jgi:cytochrome b561
MANQEPLSGKGKTRPQRVAIWVWSAHWISAAFALALLATSVMPGILLLSRAPWLSLHLTLGWTLLAITVYRCVAALKGQGQRRSLSAPRVIVAWASFAVVCLTIATGILLFRPSPLGGKVYLYGLFPAPSLHFLPHNAMSVLIQSHHYFAYGLLLIIAVHVLLAFVPHRKAGPLPVRWLWTGARTN